MTHAQRTSLQRFIEAGAILKESIDFENYFFLKTGNGKDVIIHITPNGASTVWDMVFYVQIDSKGEITHIPLE